MFSFDELKRRVEQSLTAVNLEGQPPELYEPISYTLELGGKRLRPVLCLMSCDIFGGNVEEAMPIALGLEIFHNFTLLHDDIMDQAPIRRGKPSVYKKWDANAAILSGDTMFAIAYEQITNSPPGLLPEVMKCFNKTAIEVCEGQQYDLNFENDPHVSMEEYLEMIRLKTAVLIGSCLKTGAIIAGAGEQQQSDVYAFGENIGMAFQLKDDMLDVFGDEDAFGKKQGGDIVTNKKTFLYIKALELASGSTLKKLLELYEGENHQHDQKIQEVKAIYQQLGIRQVIEDEMDDYYRQAIRFLDRLWVNEDRKKLMREVAGRIIRRRY